MAEVEPDIFTAADSTFQKWVARVTAKSKKLFASTDYMAEASGLSVPTVKRSLRKHVERGLLIPLGDSKGGRGRRSEYRVSPRLFEIVTGQPTEETRSKLDQETGSKGDQSPGSPLSYSPPSREGEGELDQLDHDPVIEPEKASEEESPDPALRSQGFAPAQDGDRTEDHPMSAEEMAKDLGKPTAGQRITRRPGDGPRLLETLGEDLVKFLDESLSDVRKCDICGAQAAEDELQWVRCYVGRFKPEGKPFGTWWVHRVGDCRDVLDRLGCREADKRNGYAVA